MKITPQILADIVRDTMKIKNGYIRDKKIDEIILFIESCDESFFKEYKKILDKREAASLREKRRMYES